MNIFICLSLLLTIVQARTTIWTPPVTVPASMPGIQPTTAEGTTEEAGSGSGVNPTAGGATEEVGGSGAGAITCLASEFECNDRIKCIDAGWKCDGDNDCNDGSDELECAGGATEEVGGAGAITCLASEFECNDRIKCIDAGWKCDGDNDCDDGSDELECGSGVNPTAGGATEEVGGGGGIQIQTWRPEATVNPNNGGACMYILGPHFECNDGSKCIDDGWKCDGENDCDDGSDELECDTTTTTEAPGAQGSSRYTGIKVTGTTAESGSVDPQIGRSEAQDTTYLTFATNPEITGSTTAAIGGSPSPGTVKDTTYLTYATNPVFTDLTTQRDDLNIEIIGDKLKPMTGDDGETTSDLFGGNGNDENSRSGTTPDVRDVTTQGNVDTSEDGNRGGVGGDERDGYTTESNGRTGGTTNQDGGTTDDDAIPPESSAHDVTGSHVTVVACASVALVVAMVM